MEFEHSKSEFVLNNSICSTQDSDYGPDQTEAEVGKYLDKVRHEYYSMSLKCSNATYLWISNTVVSM